MFIVELINHTLLANIATCTLIYKHLDDKITLVPASMNSLNKRVCIATEE